MNIPKRYLGSSGLQISTLGLGGWALGGSAWLYGWPGQDDRASIKTMRHAVDLGINWIDTAALYGLGHSEELVGQLLRDISPSERPLIFTKCGVVWDKRNPMKAPQTALRPETIRRGCEASLRRLGVEHIDVLQFHWPDKTGAPIEDSWGEMVRLIEEGKVRAGGVSNFSVALLRKCERIRHVDSLQPPLSLITRRALKAEIPWCAAHATGVVCYSPLQSGLLTDTFDESHISDLPAHDWRRHAGEFRQPRLGRNLALRDALKPIARRYGVTVAAVAAAWTLSWPGVTGTIVGALTPEQVDGWITASELQFSSSDLNEISAAISQTGAGYNRLSLLTRQIGRFAASFSLTQTRSPNFDSP